MFFKRKKPVASQAKSLAVSGKLSQSLSSDFILEAIQDGVVMVGADHIIHLLNSAAASLCGWPAQEAVGLDYQSVVKLVDEHGEPYPEAEHPFAKALAKNQPVRDNKADLLTRSGKHTPISVIVSPVREHPSQPPTAVVGVLRDITTEKEEEAQRTEFISTASHEMRTPLAAIEGYLALALNPKVSQVDDKARSYLQKAHSATEHMGQLFQELLTSSRADEGRLTSYPAVVEVGEIVAQVAESARFNANQKGLEIKYLVSARNEIRGGKVIRPLFFAFVDPNRLREVIQNLIDNSIKYTLSGTISVALTGDETVVQIQVQDTGPGIAAEDIPHLFQKFYRVDSSLTRSIGGTGLGLYICRRIVEMYEGKIWVESELGKGSTFFINLPRLTTEKALELQKTQSGLIKPENPAGN